MKRLIRSRWRYVAVSHPGMESLISHADGKTAPGVTEHLVRCERCRQTAIALNAAIQSGRQGDSRGEERIARLLRETYEILHVRMAAWHSADEYGPAPHIRSKQGRSRRLLAAIEFYFGEELARRVDRAARWDPADQILVLSAKPFFTAFLGRMAADALSREIAGAAT